MKNQLLVFAIIICFLQACKKEDKNSNPNSNPVNSGPAVTLYDYVKPDSGNYWVYESHLIDSNNSNFTSWTDSSCVKGDTLIGANVFKYIPYYIYLAGQSPFRDSSGFLECPNGYSYLKITGLPDTVSVISSTEQDVYIYCENYPHSYTTPAGTFNNIIKTTVDYYVKHPLDTTLNPIRAELLFAKDYGLIFEKFYYYFQATVGMRSERTLKSYYVQ